MQSFPKDTRLCQSLYTTRRSWAATIFEPISENLHWPPFVIALWSKPNKKLHIFLRSIKIVSVTVKVTSKRKFEDRRSEETNLEDKALLSPVRSGNSILRSRRPGRSSAGSSVSALLVTIITFTLTVWSKPSIWHQIHSTLLCSTNFFCWKQASTSAQTDPGSDSASWLHVNAEIEKDVQDNTS